MLPQWVVARCYDRVTDYRPQVVPQPLDSRSVFEYTQNDGKEAILLLALGTHEEVY